MDDQGAGGSSRGNDTYPERRQMRESSLPPTLRPHLYHAPRHANSQRIAPLVIPDWPNQPARSRSQDHGRSLPSPSHLLRQTESTLNHDHVILSRSLDASPVNPSFATNPDLPLPRLVVQRPLPPVDVPPHSTRDYIMSGYLYPPVTRSMSMSPYGSHPHSHSRAPPYGREPTSRTPQPPQPPSRQTERSPGIRDASMEDAWVFLPQPEVPVRPPRDPYAELRPSPGFTQEQRRGRSEVRGTHTSHAQHPQSQAQDLRVILEQGYVEGPQRDPQRQTEPFPSQPIRGKSGSFSRSQHPECDTYPVVTIPSPSLDSVISCPAFSSFQMSRWLIDPTMSFFYRRPFLFRREATTHRVPREPVRRTTETPTSAVQTATAASSSSAPASTAGEVFATLERTRLPGRHRSLVKFAISVLE